MRIQKISIWTVIASTMFLPIASFAEDNTVLIQGSACEIIKGDETKSTARVRASDAAAFNAISNMSSLSRFKTELDEHDFNVMVYQIVDNYVEDMNMKTSFQDEEKICVDISGYVAETNIVQAIDEVFNRQSQPEEINEDISEKTAELSDELTKELNKAVQAQQAEQEAELATKEIIIGNTGKTSQDSKTKQNVFKDETQSVQEDKSSQQLTGTLKKQGLVYVEPMAFFDGSSSDGYADLLRDWFRNSPYFLLTGDKRLAEFIVSPKILRAKVDAVNHENNRLQMVTSVDVTYVGQNKTYTDHQNRFVLYQTKDNEQEVAFELMQKLFDNSCEQLSYGMVKYLKDKQEENWGRDVLPSIITPVRDYAPPANATE